MFFILFLFSTVSALVVPRTSAGGMTYANKTVNNKPYCLENQWSSSGPSSTSYTLLCPGVCTHTDQIYASGPWDCTAPTPKVPNGNELKATMTFTSSSGSCTFSYASIDSRKPNHNYTQNAMCGSKDCPWNLLTKDPRWKWITKNISGQLIGKTVNMADANVCYGKPTTAICGKDQIAPYGHKSYNGTWMGWIKLSDSKNLWTAYKMTSNNNPACISRNSKSCIWTAEICAESLSSTADSTTPYLECGSKNYISIYGNTGYGDPNSWCSRLRQ